MTRRIRLVEFTNTFHLGGGEVQFVELLRALPRERYDLSVLALDASGPLLDDVRGMGLTPAVFDLSDSLVRPHTARQVLRLARWLREHRVDLVHAHDFYTTLLAVPACRLARVPVVVSRLDLVHWHGRARHTLLAAATHAATHVVANAVAVRRLVVDTERVPARKVSVIRNGLDLGRFDKRAVAGLNSPLPGLAPGAPVIALVANQSHEVKRQEDFLEALSQVRQHVPHATALLVGDGPRRPFLEGLARQLGLSGVVHFLGHRTDVPAVLARASLGVLCSRQEGLSNAVMEGMAATLPMVVTDVGGNAELVAHGERGLVVPPLAPAALAQALLQLLGAPQRARQMGAAGRRFVEGTLSLTQMVAEHDTLFTRLASGEVCAETPAARAA